MKRILMVDDVATNLICASEVLRAEYEVSTAKSGRQALLMMKEMTPDLILLDVNMPQMDGYEVYSKLQQNPEWASIPVIFLTAEHDMSKEIKGLEMGAMDYIHKPFEPEVMKARIDKILALTEQRKILEGEAKKDTLTNLSNRKSLENYMAMSAGSEKGYFMLIDMDNFKKVNDTFGHVVGDSVLIKLAEVFEEIVGTKERICRLGGDEFAIFLSGDIEREEVKNIARRMIATSEFEILNVLEDFSEFKVSISIGISCKPADGDSFEKLYNNADKALYFVKQNGKRGYHFYDTMNVKAEFFENENSKIDLIQLQKLISENDSSLGAYNVEYEGFKRIYRFVARCMDRKKQDAQIVLFSMYDGSKKIIPENVDLLKVLGEAVAGSLRRGDVAAKCGDGQYVVILMDANEENGRKVADRIVQKFLKEIKDDSVELMYEIESVNKNAEA